MELADVRSQSEATCKKIYVGTVMNDRKETRPRTRCSRKIIVLSVLLKDLKELERDRQRKSRFINLFETGR